MAGEVAERPVSFSERLEELACVIASPGWPASPQAVHLEVCATELERIASEARLPGPAGLSDLLRVGALGLRQAAEASHRVAPEDWQQVALWLIKLAALCARQLAAEDAETLIDDVAGLRWMPEVAPRVRELILGRLRRAGFAAAEPANIAPEIPAPTTDVARHETPTVGKPVWVSAEELELARTAIETQLLPLLQQLASAPGEQQTQCAADLEFHQGLLANALAVLGLAALAQACTQVHAATCASGCDPEVALAWHATLFEFLGAPTLEAATLLADLAVALAPDFDGAALLTEVGSLRVGLDPELLAASRQPAQADDLRLDFDADAPPGVLSAMLQELPDNAGRLARGLAAFLQDDDAEGLREAQRHAHTLKGDANAVGCKGLANLTHALEDVFIDLGRGAELDAPQREAIAAAVDCVEEVADFLLQRGPAPAHLLQTYQAVLDVAHGALLRRAGVLAADGAQTQAAAYGGAEAIAPQPASLPTSPVIPATRDDVASTAAQPAAAELEPMHAVPVRLLKELLRIAGEGIVLARQIEESVRDAAGLQRDLREQARHHQLLSAQLDDLVALRGAALQSVRLSTSHEVDALELDQYSELHVVSRRLIECNSDQNHLLQRADADMARLDDLLVAQQRVQDELQRVVLGTRTEPVANIAGRLQRVVRQAARSTGKSAELVLEGESTQVDTEMLDRMAGALGHLLRNAVDHGIEPAAQRRRAGKPERGRIRLAVANRGDSVEFLVHDDGRGLDFEAIHRRACEAGLIDAAARPGEHELAQLVLRAGFSTREEATHVSGRGIGMEAAARTVADLRGTLSLHSSTGQGMTVAISLPASLSAANVVLVRAGGDTLAAVTHGIVAITALDAEASRLDDDGRLLVRHDEDWLPAVPMAALFEADGVPDAPPPRRGFALRIAPPGQAPCMLLVDQVIDVRNVIVENLEPRLSLPPAVRGISVLGDGGMAAVVDLPLAVATLRQRGLPRVTLAPDSAARIALPRVLVADDSLSVRRALEQLLVDAGFEVATARDGLEALQKIDEARPDALLVDLEMPRMNGLDLARYLRSQPATVTLPILMITSRATDKYHEMATEAGIDRLIGKPYREDEVVNLVRGWLQAPAPYANPILE